MIKDEKSSTATRGRNNLPMKAMDTKSCRCSVFPVRKVRDTDYRVMSRCVFATHAKTYEGRFRSGREQSAELVINISEAERFNLPDTYVPMYLSFIGKVPRYLTNLNHVLYSNKRIEHREEPGRLGG